MRQVAAEELRFLLSFDVGRLSRGVLRDMQVRDPAKRRRAAGLAAEQLGRRVLGWDVWLFEAGAMRPVPTDERRGAVMAVMAATPDLTVTDLRSGHQAARDRAVGVTVARLEERFAPWVILVEEPGRSSAGVRVSRLPWDEYVA